MAEMLDYAAGGRSRHPWARTGTVLGWVSLVLLLPVASLTGLQARMALPDWGFWLYLVLNGLRFVLAAALLWAWHGWSRKLERLVWLKLAVEGISAMVGSGLFAHYIWGRVVLPRDWPLALGSVFGDAVVGLSFAVFVMVVRVRVRNRASDTVW